jgi:hypothetical protein
MGLKLPPLDYEVLDESLFCPDSSKKCNETPSIEYFLIESFLTNLTHSPTRAPARQPSAKIAGPKKKPADPYKSYLLDAQEYERQIHD